MITQTEVVDYLKQVKVGELQSLITTLEDELGVKATAPVLFPNTNPEPIVAQTEFEVVLTGFTDKKVMVIKAVRKATGLGLKEAKVLVDEAPSTIQEALTREAADELADVLRAASGVVDVK
jgi:large subunit ribosomal protein L7/L12